MNTKERLSIKRVLNSLIDELVIEVQILWMSKGVPSNSDLIKSMEIKNKRNSLQLYANEYYQWLDSGRKKNIKKIPISALIQWLKKYRITPSKGLSINQLAYIIQNTIYKNGIKGRKFIKQTENTIEKIMTKELEKFYLTEIENGIIKVLNRK